MGAMLSNPVETKVMERNGNDRYRIGVSSMNGWRVSMEDSHSIHMHDDWGFFGVFDGHSGFRCSEFMAAKFPEAVQAEVLPHTLALLIATTSQKRKFP